MPGKRATTPLFDLLQQGRGRRFESHLPESDAPGTTPPPGVEREPRGAGFAEAPIRIVGGVVQMPLMYAAVAVVVALVAVLGAWTLGYQRSERKAKSEQRLLESALGPGSRVVEPDSEGPGRVPTTDRPPANAVNPGQGQRPNTNQNARPVPTVGQAAFLTGAGPTETDPRLPMHNYLQLGSSIRPAEVESAIAFLASRSLDCFGAIDPGSRGRNDGPLYVLFAGLGFPSGEADSPEARRYREQVVAAGTAWRQAGGVKNFDDATWALRKP